MFDPRLKAQHLKKPERVFLSPPHMGGDEMRYIREAFESNYIAPLGPQVDAFEKAFCEYTGFKHCVALTSGTAAMHLALRYLLKDREIVIAGGRERDDYQSPEVRGQKSEGGSLLTAHSSLLTSFHRPLVLASTLTFIGSVTPAVFEGCDITFIDCDRETWNMDPDLLTEELARCEKEGRLPVAVVPTDLYGQCCNLLRIVEICDGYGVPVVCDSAESLGAKYLTQSRKGAKTLSTVFVHAGRGAKAAVFSFNGNKIITTSGGGMLASDDKELVEKARFWSQQARDPFPHYEHTEIGYNYRMSNIVAAIGLGQLQVLEDRVLRKREIFEYYREALGDLPGISFMPEAAYGRSNRWLTVILIDHEESGADREVVRLALEAENIEARPVWKPMHLQPVFHPRISQISADYNYNENGEQRAEEGHCQRSEVGGLRSGTDGGRKSESCSQFTDHGSLFTPKYGVVGGKVSEELFEKGLCLPSGTALGEGDLERVVGVIRGMMKR